MQSFLFKAFDYIFYSLNMGQFLLVSSSECLLESAFEVKSTVRVSSDPEEAFTKFNCSKRPHQQALSASISGEWHRPLCQWARCPELLSESMEPRQRLDRQWLQIRAVKARSALNRAQVWIVSLCLYCKGFSVTGLLLFKLIVSIHSFRVGERERKNLLNKRQLRIWAAICDRGFFLMGQLLL